METRRFPRIVEKEVAGKVFKTYPSTRTFQTSNGLVMEKIIVREVPLAA